MDVKTYLDYFRVVADETGASLEIRRRGSAVTYKAEDLRSGSEVRLNVLPAERLSPETIQELERKAAGAKELTHTNLPRLRAFGRDTDHVVYASEYFDGTLAEDWVKAHGPMPVGPVLRIGVQVVSALAAATFHGITHGAINPRNILLVPGRTAEGDWPLVKILGLLAPAPDFTDSQFTAAQPEFAAQFASPEQLQSASLGFRSEIYSLGATLWFLLTSTPPADAALVPRVSGLPKPVLQLIEEMMAPNPDDRPRDPVVLQERLRTCLQGAERREAIGRKLGLSTSTLVRVSKKRSRSRLWRPLAIAVVVLFFAALGAFFWSHNRDPGQLFGSHEDEPIGVPIGVAVAETTPEQSSPVAANQVAIIEPPPAAVAKSDVEVQPTNRPAMEPAPIVAQAGPPPMPVNEPPASPARRELSLPAAVKNKVEVQPISRPTAEPVVAQAAPSIAPPVIAQREPPSAAATENELKVHPTNRPKTELARDLPEETGNLTVAQAAPVPAPPLAADEVVTSAAPPLARWEREVETQLHPTNRPTPEPAAVIAAAAPSIAPLNERSAQLTLVRREPLPPAEGPAKTSLPPAPSVEKLETADRPSFDEDMRRAELALVQKLPLLPSTEVQNTEPTMNGLPVRRAEPVPEEQPAVEARRSALANKPPNRVNGRDVRAADPVRRASRSPKRARHTRFLGIDENGSLVFEIPPPPVRPLDPRR